MGESRAAAFGASWNRPSGTRVDRLARSIGNLQDIVRTVKAKGAALKATEQRIDTCTAAAKRFLDMLGAGIDFSASAKVRRDRSRRARWRRHSRRRKLHCKAVEQAVATSGDEVGLAAAARHVCRVPRLRQVIRLGVPVYVSQHSRAEGAAGPVVAGQVQVGRPRAAIGLRACQCVVPVRRHADPGDHVAAFRERGLLVEIVVRTVQFVDILGDHDALGVLPRSLADAVAGIDGTTRSRRTGAQVGMPSLVARVNRVGQSVAMRVRAGEATKIAAFAEAGAGDEEGGVWCLRYLLSARR